MRLPSRHLCAAFATGWAVAASDAQNSCSVWPMRGQNALVGPSSSGLAAQAASGPKVPRWLATEAQRRHHLPDLRGAVGVGARAPDSRCLPVCCSGRFACPKFEWRDSGETHLLNPSESERRRVDVLSELADMQEQLQLTSVMRHRSGAGDHSTS